MFRLIHLREHKLKQDFQNAINPLCSCSLEVESISQFFSALSELRRMSYKKFKFKCPVNELIKIISCIQTLDEKSFKKLLLYTDGTKLLTYGDGRYDNKTNASLISASIKFLYFIVNVFIDNAR